VALDLCGRVGSSIPTLVRLRTLFIHLRATEEGPNPENKAAILAIVLRIRGMMEPMECERDGDTVESPRETPIAPEDKRLESPGLDGTAFDGSAP